MVAAVVGLFLAWPTAGRAQNPLDGYWKLDGSPTSAVVRVLLQPGGAPQWGWSPQYKGSVWRPGGCYRSAGQAWWVIGFAGGGAFHHYIYQPEGCGASDILTSRWYLRKSGTMLEQRYVLDEDGISGPSPGRQIRFKWFRTQPSIRLGHGSYDAKKRKLEFQWRYEAVWKPELVVVDAKHTAKVLFRKRIGAERSQGRIFWHDGVYTATVPDLGPGSYRVSLSARSGPQVTLETDRVYVAK